MIHKPSGLCSSGFRDVGVFCNCYFSFAARSKRNCGTFFRFVLSPTQRKLCLSRIFSKNSSRATFSSIRLESHFQAYRHCAELRPITGSKDVEGVVFVVDADVVNDDFSPHSNRETALVNVLRCDLLFFAILVITRLERAPGCEVELRTYGEIHILV